MDATTLFIALNVLLKALLPTTDVTDRLRVTLEKRNVQYP